MYKMCVLASAGLLVQGSLWAQTRPARAASMPQLVINGQVVGGRLLLQGNRYWVSLEDLARSVQATILYQKDRIVLSFGAARVALETVTATPAPVAPAPVASAPVASAPKTLGSIRGTLTYYFNANYGNKPDVGAEVILVEGRVNDLPEDQFYFHSVPGHETLRSTIADGNGNFEIHGLALGTYTVVVRSQHVRGAMGDGAGGSSPKISERDLEGRLYVHTVTLGENQPEADASWDFGMSTLP